MSDIVKNRQTEYFKYIVRTNTIKLVALLIYICLCSGAILYLFNATTTALVITITVVVIISIFPVYIFIDSSKRNKDASEYVIKSWLFTYFTLLQYMKKVSTLDDLNIKLGHHED